MVMRNIDPYSGQPVLDESPTSMCDGRRAGRVLAMDVARSEGFEPPTPRFEVWDLSLILLTVVGNARTRR
jgi:hypothetical protein